MNEQHENLDFTALPKSVINYIKQLENVRSDFVANVSHELRTPLTVIRGYLETLLNKEDTNAIAHQKIFKQMYQHSIRMENIVNDLLLLSRLENEENTNTVHEIVNIPTLLETLAIDAKRISGDKNHFIKTDIDPKLYLFGSIDEFKSLFSNIVVNAIKYTPKHGTITIKWYQKQEHPIFSVTDSGIGIAKKHISRIT